MSNRWLFKISDIYSYNIGLTKILLKHYAINDIYFFFHVDILKYILNILNIVM